MRTNLPDALAANSCIYNMLNLFPVTVCLTNPSFGHPQYIEDLPGDK